MLAIAKGFFVFYDSVAIASPSLKTQAARQRKSCTAVNNKRAFTWIISLDFQPKAWYVVLLEGGECFGAAEEEHPSKSN